MGEVKNFSFFNKLRNILYPIGNWLLPRSCFLCGDDSTQLLCPACLADLPYHPTACRCCAIPLPTVNICGRCQKHPPHFTRTQALFSYTYPADQLIVAAKFQRHFAMLHFLGKLMAQHLNLDNPPAVLIPVPTHPKRLRERGYNQSVELAKAIAMETSIPVDYNACSRIKDTLRQIGLSAKQRKLNLKNAFQVQYVKAPLATYRFG